MFRDKKISILYCAFPSTLLITLTAFTLMSELIPAQAQSYAQAGDSLSLQDIEMMGGLAAGRNVQCNRCKVEGGISAGQHVQLNHCPDIGRVAAGADVQLNDTRVTHHISAGNSVSLNDSEIQGNISAGGPVMANRSTILGTVTLGGPALKLSDSHAQDIRFSGGFGGYHGHFSTRFSGSNIQVSGGGAVISMGSSGLSSMNGYLVKSGMGQTTVITPSQTVYINGKKASGTGPNQYETYRHSTPGAPLVNGPGWPDGMTNSAADSKYDAESEFIEKPLLEVRNHSTIEGDVIFEDVPGVVILQEGSVIKGKVQNGKIKRES